MSQAKILLVDDDARVRRVISSMLARHPGWEICGEAADGKESIEQARAKNPDIVLMDVSMPGMNGLDATRILRREIPQIDVILVSQNDPKVVSRQAIEVGASAYCTKSDLARNLVPIIERAIEARHAQCTHMSSQNFARRPSDQAGNLLAAIVDSSDDVIISKTLDGIITSWNKAAERVFGYSATEAIGKSITLIIPKDRLQEENDIISRVKRGEHIHHFDTIRQRKDGSLLDLSVTISPVKDSSGRVVGASKLAREITERKRAERNTALLAAIVDSSDDAIVGKTLDGIITTWNHSAERVFGYPADEAIGKHITLIIPRERWNEEASIIERIRRGDRVDHFQTVRRRKDGSLVDVSLTISPVKDSSGQIIGASKVARDIGPQVRAVEALRDSEEKFRTVIETANDAVLVADRNGCVIELNPKAESMFGYRRDEILGQSISILMPERHRVAYHQALERFRSTGESHVTGKTIEFEGLASDGREFPLQVSLASWITKSSIFFTAFLRDITERKQAEQSLKESEERFRNLSKTLDAEIRARTRELLELSWQLMRARDEERKHVARELHDSAGQSLAVLAMEVDLLIHKLADLPGIAAQAEQIRETVRQLHSEIRTTSYLLHPPLLDETGLQAAISWYAGGLTERTGLLIEVVVPEDLGRLPRDLELALFRFVQEALTNIHRHSAATRAGINISRSDGWVTAEVADDGKGMSAERLAQVRSGGSGLGIRGMRERIRQFQGSMEIHSDPSGTKVSVAIPLPADTNEDLSQDLKAAV